MVFFCFSLTWWGFEPITPITESVSPVESGWTCSCCGLQNHLQSFVYLRLAYLPLLFVCSSVNSVVQPLLAVCISSVFVLFAIAAPPPFCRDVSGILIFFYNDFRWFQDPWSCTRAGDFPPFVNCRLTSSLARRVLASPPGLVNHINPWARVGAVAVYCHVVLAAPPSAAGEPLLTVEELNVSFELPTGPF